MPEKPDNERHDKPEEINPAPWMGRVGDGATLPAGEYISREIRDLTDRARQMRHEGADKPSERDKP